MQKYDGNLSYYFYLYRITQLKFIRMIIMATIIKV